MPSELETAAHPENLKRVVIEPVTRVEGHGKVTLLLDEDNRVHQARFHIVEFRGFEKFIQGRPYTEVPVLVQRLCGMQAQEPRPPFPGLWTRLQGFRREDLNLALHDPLVVGGLAALPTPVSRRSRYSAASPSAQPCAISSTAVAKPPASITRRAS